jgi:glutaminyl-peptide cyclotransferase
MKFHHARTHASGHVVSGLSTFTLLLHILVLTTYTPRAAAHTELSDHFLSLIPSGGDDYDIHDGKLLAPILIPRVPGTDGQTKVQEHFVNFFRTELPSWDVEWYNSTGTTPATGSRELPFANLLFKREPPWVKEGDGHLLTLVAHYDSKIAPEGFIGATDSAAPCAMLMHVARTLDGYLDSLWDQLKPQADNGEPGLNVGVQILLLDGEEAFVSWTATDSLYGSRALAAQWEDSYNPPLSTFRNPMDQISLFVLLDLLGAADPKVPSYFLTTHWAYKAMANIEARMRGLGLLESSPSKPFLYEGDKEVKSFRKPYVGDDHQPFMHRGVDILHLIPSPFPEAWHKIIDDGEHLDLATVRDWGKITLAFAMEWLDIMKVEPAEG